MERKNKSPVWRVFVKDAARKRTLCTKCGKEFKYRYTTTNLRDHLKRYHPEWLPDNGENSIASETKEVQIISHSVATNELQLIPYAIETKEGKVLPHVVRDQNIHIKVANAPLNISSIPEECEPGRKNKSAVWQVFVKDAENKNVVCTICQKEFKFWNNTTNLHTHLKRTHPEWCPENQSSFNENSEDIDCDDEQLETDSRHSSASSVCSFSGADPDSLPGNDSPVWRVFVKDDSNKGIFCTLCQKHFGSLNNEMSMIDHLRKLHPEWEPSTEENISGGDVKSISTENDVITKSVFVLSGDRKNRSPVWDVFVKDTTRKQSTCLLCKRVFKCYSNTANLLDHLRRLHPDWKLGSGNMDHKNELSPKRPTITRIRNPSETSEGKASVSFIQTPYSQTNNTSVDIKSNQVDKLIGEMICMDFQSLNIVEDTGFRNLMKELVPNYNPPKRKTVVKEILPGLYENVSSELRQTLAKCKYVAVSVELWSNHSMETFMTLTVHYYSNEKFKSSVLHTERINTEHNSSRDLASVMHTVLNEHWQIFQKITAIVTDDDAALRDACDMLNITHIPCVAQILNTMITEELTQNDEAQQLLQRCLNLVAHFKLNPSAYGTLQNIQAQHGLPLVSLKQVAPTRWNSALHMAQRLVDLKEPLLEAFQSIPEVADILSDADWLNLTDFISVLNPFEWMTSELSTDSYSNISKVVPLIRGVQTNLQNINCVSNFGVITRKSLLEKLEIRLATYEKYTIPPVATLLDPRFKKAGLGVENAIEFSRTYVIEQLTELKNATSEEKRKTDEKPPPGNSDIWNFLEKKLKESQKAPTASAELSLKHYLDLPYLNRDECPFRFWLGQSNLEPELSDMAMKFMCIPATSFPAERLYSKFGVHVTERRSRMSTKHFDMIIFLNKNLQKNSLD